MSYWVMDDIVSMLQMYKSIERTQFINETCI